MCAEPAAGAQREPQLTALLLWGVCDDNDVSFAAAG